jgi:hypothetical protein
MSSRPHYPSDDLARSHQRPRSITPGDHERAKYRRRCAARRSRYLCPICFEGCHSPEGHATLMRCLGALEAAYYKDVRAKEVERIATVLDQRWSPA